MSSRARRSFIQKFKAGAALAALWEDSTLADLASPRDMHPNQISHWKQEAAHGLAEVFDREVKPEARMRVGGAREAHL